jgi:hypothetical protein
MGGTSHRGRGRNNGDRGTANGNDRSDGNGGHGNNSGGVAGGESATVRRKGIGPENARRRSEMSRHMQHRWMMRGNLPCSSRAPMLMSSRCHCHIPRCTLMNQSCSCILATRKMDGTHARFWMTRECAAFSDLDTKVCGMVRFGDGSVNTIEGHDTVLLKCKNGEHKALAGVYLIPRLNANIVSLRQLEEVRCCILLHNGYLKIWDQKGGTLGMSGSHNKQTIFLS